MVSLHYVHRLGKPPRGQHLANLAECRPANSLTELLRQVCVATI